MGIFDAEIKLPGVITQVEADYSAGYDPSAFGTTDSVAIIGTAFNGQVGVPVPVYSVEHAVYIFGSAYDSATRKEATLVSGIQDAWDRGCRTIYAVRVGGKDIYKDFKFNIDSEFKLRVSSTFPSNVTKDCYFTYDSTAGAESITYYKPTDRATISEKRRGVVGSSTGEVIKNVININTDLGLTKNDRLVDLISRFNEAANNNVLKLSIVDKDGNDVTASSEVYALPIGILFPGTYFLGREKSLCKEKVELSFIINEDGVVTPYDGMTEAYFRKLVINTDVTQPYPIYADSAHKTEFRTILANENITVTKDWDFLSVANLSDRAFAKDKVDYEETQLSKFEIYKRLGSGFAVTAKATKRNNATPRIAETPTSDPNRVQPIIEGIYNNLEDANIKYRVLACANADDSINGKLPRANDFKQVSPVSMTVANGMIELTPKVDADDFSASKKYSVTLKEVDSISGNLSETFTETVFNVLPISEDENEVKTAGLKEGTKILVKVADGEYKLMRVDSKGLTVLDDASYEGVQYIADSKIYTGERGADEKIVFKPVAISGSIEIGGTSYKNILGDMLDSVFVFSAGDSKLEPLGDFASVFGSEEETAVSFYAESFPFEENEIVISSHLFDNITIEELVDEINKHPVLGALFSAALTEEGTLSKDDFVKEKIMPDTTEIKSAVLEADRNADFNYSLYIPYRTNDNFVRQLAQHCTYVELKTCPTFGFIGTSRMVNTGLTSIAKRVNELLEMNFDLYAKTNYGINMLDRQGLPYPVGKNVNVVFGQYFDVMENDNFTFLSNGAAGYAGMVSQLPLDQSSTCQPIALSEINFNLSQSQLSALTAAGIVTFRQSFTKGIVVTDGVTMAPADSVYRRLASSRIVGAFEDLLRAAAEPFIGKQNHAANRNALSTAIKSRLDKIVGTLVEDYDFTMSTDNSNKFSIINISYMVVPIYEIREIRNSIKITDTLASTTTGSR